MKLEGKLKLDYPIESITFEKKISFIHIFIKYELFFSIYKNQPIKVYPIMEYFNPMMQLALLLIIIHSSKF